MAGKLSDQARKARRRMQLITPENSRKVLAKDIYWCREFLQLYLDYCDETAFEDPRAGLRLAHIAHDLAKLIDVGDRPGEYVSTEEKRGFEVYAIAVLGSVLRRLEDMTGALEQYQRASRLGKNGPITPRAEAELSMRFGYFKSEMDDPESLTFYTRALDLFTAAHDPSGSALVLVLQADWFYHQGSFSAASECLARALHAASECPHDGRSKRAIVAALGNYARLLCEEKIVSSDSIAALPLIKQARRLLSRSSSTVKAKLMWIEGSLNRTLQCPLQALRLFAAAREIFRTMSLAGDFTLVSLEMAVSLYDESELEQLQEIREETVATLHRLTDDPLLLHAISRWKVQSTRESLLEIKQQALLQC